MPDSQPISTKIAANNPPLEQSQTTFLTVDAAAGATTLNVLSNSGLLKAEHGAADFYVFIGYYGQEKAEIKLVTASDTPGNTLTVAATTYSHSASEPVSFIAFNKIRFFGMTAVGGAKNPLDTLAIDPTSQFTYYDYSAVSPTYSFFCSAWYNATSGVFSDYSEIIQTGDLARATAKRLIKSAARKSMARIDESSTSNLNWNIALEVLMDGIDEIQARKRKWNFLHTIDSSVSSVANTAYVSKPSDVGIIENIAFNGVRLNFASHIKFDEFTRSGSTTLTGTPLYWTERNSLIYFTPTPDTAKTITFDYYKKVANLTNLSSTIDTVFIPILIYYCASQFCFIKGNDKRGDKMYALFAKLLEQQVEEHTGPWQTGDAEEIESTSLYSFDEEGLI